MYDEYRMNAIILAQSINYASPPSMGENRSSIMSKKRGWDKFMDSLDFRKITKKKVIQTSEEVMSLFGPLGIPVNVKGGGK